MWREKEKGSVVDGTRGRERQKDEVEGGRNERESNDVKFTHCLSVGQRGRKRRRGKENIKWRKDVKFTLKKAESILEHL